MPGFWWLLPLLLQSFKVEGEIRAGFCNGPNIERKNCSTSPFPVPLNGYIHNVTVLIYFFLMDKKYKNSKHIKDFFFSFFFQSVITRNFLACYTVSVRKVCFQVSTSYFRKKCWQYQTRVSISEVTWDIVEENSH